MERLPLDYYDYKPAEMIAYFRHNGMHFNKKLCEWAVSHMKKKNTSTDKLEPIETWSKDDVDTLLKAQGVTLTNNTGYDYVYVANMAKADFYKSSLATEAQVALFVKDMVDDADQVDGFIYNRFYADCVLNGTPIPWEEMI